MKQRTYLELPIHQIAFMATLALVLAFCGPDWSTETGAVSGLLGRHPETRTLEAGTRVQVRFEEALSSHESQPGEIFRARVERDVTEGHEVLVPQGATVVGSVVEARSGAREGDAVRLILDFHLLELPDGESVPLAASLVRGAGGAEARLAEPAAAERGSRTDGGKPAVIAAESILTLELAEAAEVPVRTGRGAGGRQRMSSR